jgi:hypothetical protein
MSVSRPAWRRDVQGKPSTLGCALDLIAGDRA